MKYTSPTSQDDERRIDNLISLATFIIIISILVFASSVYKAEKQRRSSNIDNVQILESN